MLTPGQVGTVTARAESGTRWKAALGGRRCGRGLRGPTRRRGEGLVCLTVASCNRDSTQTGHVRPPLASTLTVSSYRRSMRQARRDYRKAVARGGRTWTREDLYERVRTR